MAYIKNLSPEDIAELTLEAEVTYGDEQVAREWNLLALALEEEYAKKKLEALMVELHRVERDKKAGKDGDIEGIMKEINGVSKRIQEIKNQTIKL